MEFRLKIVLGNDAVQTGDDVADLLTDVIEEVNSLDALSVGDGGRITDANGNGVGSWEVVQP